ncbi:MAG: ribosome small subunit-dependent GTPase A [Clostridia bacterium]|nr:ribosome small subunit-dependent GTPase A [Clostridia bacterium]
MVGRIIKAISSFYYIEDKNRIIECKARGNFRQTGVSPVVGDFAEFSLVDESHGVIEKIKERKNCLSRPLIANIDKILIVSSYSCPAPDTLIIDRLTAVSEYYNIEPIIVFNKCDTGDFEIFEKIYRNSGYKTFTVSATENIGIEELKQEIGDSVCAFAGNSGVGKSSLINALAGLKLETSEVSRKLGRGRHTTRHTVLYKTERGGYIADTPGFSSFESKNSEYDFKIHLAECFPEFRKYLGSCRFVNCTHTCEKECAVLEALNEGKIEKTRHKSYLSFFEELKDLKEWQKQ